MTTWVKHGIPELTPEMEEKLRTALARRRVLLERRLGPTQGVRVDLVPSPSSELPGRHFWVHWFGNNSDAWPPEDDPYIFSKTEHGEKRLASWVFPTAEQAAEFVKKTWNVHCVIPYDVRMTKN